MRCTLVPVLAVLLGAVGTQVGSAGVSLVGAPLTARCAAF